MQISFGATPKEVGLIPTLTQAGYALGMLFLIPLGDRFEKRNLIFISTIVSALSLLLMAWSPSLNVAIASSLIIGIATMTPQFIIPLAAQLAQPEKRGQVMGLMISGVLLGILLARTVSGFIGAAYGWRVMFVSAAVVLVILSVVLRLLLPVAASNFNGS
jgi:predicted MFS family arabinose efflux permease